MTRRDDDGRTVITAFLVALAALTVILTLTALGLFPHYH
jgi:hypothetical protein